MGCTTSLRDQLPGSSGGGTWTYLGYNVNFPGSPGLGGTNPGALVGDNPTLDWSNFIAGFYHFRYTVGEAECREQRTLIIHVQENGNAGEGDRVAICLLDQPNIDLFDYLTGNSTNGIWSANPNSPDDGSGALSGSIVNVGSLSPGTYIFDYNISLSNLPDFDVSDCEDCFSLASVIIDLEGECEPGTGGTFGFPSGSFDMFSLLTGIPDVGGTWQQVAGSDVIPITNDFLGTINLDTAEDCEYEFAYTCDAPNGCENTTVLRFVQQVNFSVTIAFDEPSDSLVSTVTGCTGTATYQWQESTPSGFIDIVGATSPELRPFDLDKLYRLIVTCGNCEVTSNTIIIETDCTCNNPGVGLTFNFDTDCLEIDPTGDTCSTIDTDVIEWRRVGGSTYTQDDEVCDCDLFDFLDVTPSCNISGSNVQIGYSAVDRCGGSIDRVYVLFGDGTQTIESGADITSTFFNVNKSDYVNKFNRTAILVVRLNLGGGNFLFQEIEYFWTGGTSGGTCGSLQITKLNFPRLYYAIEARRTVTFTDICPPVEFVDIWTPPVNCDNFYVLLTQVNLGGQPAISGEVFGCSTVTRQWYKDGVLLTGETGLFILTNTYGLGFYELIAEGCGCSGSASINLSGCDQSIQLSVSGGTYTATISGCAGSKLYEWQRFVNGSWVTESSNTTTSNSQSFTPAISGQWRIRVTCLANDCVSAIQFDVNLPCTVGVSLIFTGGNLQATATNCSGSKTYVFQRWNGSTWVTVNTQTTTNNTVTYTPTQSGLFRVNLTCIDNNCTATAQTTIEVGCTTETFVSEPVGGVFTGTVTGCPGTKTWTWQRWNGSSWQTEQTTTNAAASNTFTPLIQALYRLRVTCLENGCVSDREFTFTPDCNTSASIIVSGNTLIANVVGCVGTIFYSWFYRATPGSGSWGSPVGTGSSYNTGGVAGEYRLVANCDGCTAEAFITITGCNISVSVNCGSLPLTANVVGCTGAITYQWQYSPTGTGWQVVGTNSTLSPQNGAGFYRVIVFCDGCNAVSNICELTDNCNVIASLTTNLDKCDWVAPINTKRLDTVIIRINGLTAVSGIFNLDSTNGRNLLKSTLETWLSDNNYGGTVTYNVDIYGKDGVCLNILCTKANPEYIQFGSEKTFFGGCSKTCTYVFDIPNVADIRVSDFKYGCTVLAPWFREFDTEAADIKIDIEAALSGGGFSGTVTVDVGARTITIVTNAPIGLLSAGVPAAPSTLLSATQSSCGSPTFIYPTITLTLSNCSGTQVIQWQRLIGSTWTLVQTGGLTLSTCTPGSYRAIGTCGDCPFTSNTIVI